MMDLITAKKWKLIIHLLFLTKHFGVNNEWWVKYQPAHNISTIEMLYRIVRIKPIIDQYHWLKFKETFVGEKH